MSKGQQDIEGQMSLFDFIPEGDAHTTLERKNEYEMHHCKACGHKVPNRVIYGTWPFQGIKLEKRCPGCNRIIDHPQDMLDIADSVNNHCTNNVDKCNRTEIWAKAAADCPQTCCHECTKKCKAKKQLICMYLDKNRVFNVDIRGFMDDPYCPGCGRGFWDYGPKSEVDCDRCPDCGIRISWDRWHQVNDKYHGGENEEKEI